MERKLRVMLVDDEPNILKGLRQLIDWESEGYDIVCTAHNRQEALLQYSGQREQVNPACFYKPVYKYEFFCRNKSCLLKLCASSLNKRTAAHGSRPAFVMIALICKGGRRRNVRGRSPLIPVPPACRYPSYIRSGLRNGRWEQARSGRKFRP